MPRFIDRAVLVPVNTLLIFRVISCSGWQSLDVPQRRAGMVVVLPTGLLAARSPFECYFPARPHVKSGLVRREKRRLDSTTRSK